MHHVRLRLWDQQRDIRWIVYLKDENADAAALKRTTGVDEIVRLNNTGREAGTYLRHILRHYNDTIDPAQSGVYRAGLADHTRESQSL